MASKSLRGKELRHLGYPEGRVIKVAQQMLDKHFKGKSKTFKLDLMKKVIESPDDYLNNPVFRLLVRELQAKQGKTRKDIHAKRTPYKVFGMEGIEPNTIHQMEMAMKLPIAVGGALMPDAHFGYGLPIGGVLAAENAVIPYGVGLDIGCRMSLSILDVPVAQLEQHPNRFESAILKSSRFGQDVFDRPKDDAIFSRSEFRELQSAKRLKDLAFRQIGTSGSGNHFVEIGTVEMNGHPDEPDVPKGAFLAILTHSGSRGLGANLARYYTKIATLTCKLPEAVARLAWLSLDTEQGQEYWMAMNLAGDYAKACHDQIHARIINELGAQRLINIENHHNFAWKESMADGREVIVHRKGATPAGEGVMGIIPGSMTANGYVVRGKGNAGSLNSASHGAGRAYSRSEAKQFITQQDVDEELALQNVRLLGGGVDESPFVYKNIEAVMSHQSDLVDVIGTFRPRIVRMAGA